MFDPFESLSGTQQPVDGSVPKYRSAAVARMLCMPVSTLRIWERRYRVTSPTTTPSGHRLYSAAEVQRLALLKQLTGVGHAIGSIANLDMVGLRRVAATHMQSMNMAQPVADATVPWSVAVVGDGLVQRLQRPELVRQLGRRIEVAVSFGGIAEAAQGRCERPVDTLLVQAAGLHLKWLPQLQKAIDILSVRHVLVCYGYGTKLAINAFEALGVVLLRSASVDRDLAKVLCNIEAQASTESASEQNASAENLLNSSVQQLAMIKRPDGSKSQEISATDESLFAALVNTDPPAPSRYHPATLVEMASLSTTLSCECPGHVAQLLTLLTEFETYSAECVQLYRTDADVHTYLQYTAGRARELFEAALERLALHEGIILSA